MSLFGTSPTGSQDEPVTPSRTKGTARKGGDSAGLFDEPSHSQSTTGLFADENSADGPTPWDLPTPRKQQSRAQIIRNLLPSSDVPESYIESFDTVVHQDGVAGKVTAAGVAKVFACARLETDSQARIMGLLSTGDSSGSEVTLDRNEFNVLLALVGLAQEGETISLDGVDERRKSESGLQRPSLYRLQSSHIVDFCHVNQSFARHLCICLLICVYPLIGCAVPPSPLSLQAYHLLYQKFSTLQTLTVSQQ